MSFYGHVCIYTMYSMPPLLSIIPHLWTHPFIFSLSPSNCDTSIHRCLRPSVSSGSLSVRMNL